MKIFKTLVALLFCISINAQTTHTINTGSFYYTPSTLTINVGDSVIWINDGGTHDVNGDTNSITNQPYNNPVIFDSLSARNGGMLFKQGEVFRVFQRQGWNIYGEAFGVTKITELTDSTYDEEVQFIVEPKFFKGIKGTHTYSYKNGLIAVDFVEINNIKK